MREEDSEATFVSLVGIDSIDRLWYYFDIEIKTVGSKRMPVLNGYFNVIEAANFLGLHPETVKRLCRSGRLPGEKVHNGWLVHIDQLGAFKSTYRENRGRRPNARSAGKAREFSDHETARTVRARW